MITCNNSLYQVLTSFNRIRCISQRVPSTIRIISSYPRYQSTAATTSSKADPDENIKPFDEMPQPDGSIFKKISFLLRNFKILTEQAHIGPTELFKTLGPIYKITTGEQVLVITADPKAAECMFRTEGKFPIRVNMGPWIAYRHERNLPLGILLA